MALFSTLTADRRIKIFVLLFYARLPEGSCFLEDRGGDGKNEHSAEKSSQNLKVVEMTFFGTAGTTPWDERDSTGTQK